MLLLVLFALVAGAAVGDPDRRAFSRLDPGR